MPSLYGQPALLRILPLLVVPVCAKRFHMHYSGQRALLNRHYRGTLRGLDISVLCGELFSEP